jgi:hypothetical protein
MRQTRHVACMRDIKNVYKILLENLKGRNHLHDLGIDCGTILIDLK